MAGDDGGKLHPCPRALPAARPAVLNAAFSTALAAFLPLKKQQQCSTWQRGFLCAPCQVISGGRDSTARARISRGGENHP